MTPADEIVTLKAENAALHEQAAALTAHVQELRARLAKVSRTSNKPPWSDGLDRAARETKSLRQRSGKRLRNMAEVSPFGKFAR